VIIFDTNVVSELLRTAADPKVMAWASRIPRETIVTTAITEAELRFGVAKLPLGRRRTLLGQQVDEVLEATFAGRILPFDRQAAAEYATFAAARQTAGRPVPTNDAMIAAIARAHGATAIATRNLRDFDGCGVPLMDPWSG